MGGFQDGSDVIGKERLVGKRGGTLTRLRGRERAEEELGLWVAREGHRTGGKGGGGGSMMAEPRRVPFISLSPVRRREGESPVLERETGGGREAEQPLAREGLKLPDQQEHYHHHHHYDNSRVDPPSQPFESCPRPESHPVSLPREISRPEPTPKPPQPPPHRESPRPEAPPLSSHQQLNQENNRQESPPPLDQTIRFELILKDPTEESCVEFSYPELLWSGKARVLDLQTLALYLPFLPPVLSILSYMVLLA